MIRRASFLFVLFTLLGSPAVWANSEVVRRDISYGPHILQAYDAYLPRRAKAKRAAVVMLHGGGWRFGDKRNRGVWQAKARHWNAQGLAFFSVNTRLLPGAGPLKQTRDLARAVAHIQTNAETYGIAPQRLVLMGHSAGGHIVALLNADPGIGHEFDLQPWVGAVILDTAVFDVPTFMSNDPSRLHIAAFGPRPADWSVLSPRHRLTEAAAPMLSVCSLKRKGACDASGNFSSFAKEMGVAVDVQRLDLTHRQINVELGTPGALTRGVDAFLHKVLGF